MVRFLICLLSSVAMLLMFPGSVATFPKETFRLTSSYICPKNLFPLASTSLYWSRWLKKKNGKIVTDIQWAPDFVKLNQRTVLEAYRVNIIIIWNIASLKCICQDTYDQTKPLFFRTISTLKRKYLKVISKLHILYFQAERKISHTLKFKYSRTFSGPIPTISIQIHCGWARMTSPLFYNLLTVLKNRILGVLTS